MNYRKEDVEKFLISELTEAVFTRNDPLIATRLGIASGDRSSTLDLTKMGLDIIEKAEELFDITVPIHLIPEYSKVQYLVQRIYGAILEKKKALDAVPRHLITFQVSSYDRLSEEENTYVKQTPTEEDPAEWLIERLSSSNRIVILNVLPLTKKQYDKLSEIKC